MGDISLCRRDNIEVSRVIQKIILLLIGVFISYNLYNLNIFLQINRINYFDKLIITIIFISIIIFSSLLVLYIYLSRIYFFLNNIPSIKINFKIAFFSFKKIIYIISLIFITFFILFQF